MLGLEAMGGVKSLMRSQISIGDRSAAVCGPVQRWIVEDHGDAIGAEMDVEFEITVCVLVDRSGERIHGVLRPQDRAAPVGESDRVLDGKEVAHMTTPRLTTAATMSVSGRYGR